MNFRVHRSPLVGVVLVAVIPLLPGCGASKSTPRGAKSDGKPYSLYTHCGIREARIGDTYFIADHPLDDGQGNPPPGWGNPYQDGTITTSSRSVAVFRDSAGHAVRFHARPGATSFVQLCS